MDIKESSFPGVFSIHPQSHPDTRGRLAETYRQDALEEAVGGVLTWRQNNVSVSRSRVIRGLHFSIVPGGQQKYVTCVQGTIWDVIMDVRESSPTFGQYVSYTLSGDALNSVFIPSGFAHGFLVTSPEEAVVSYLVSTPYQPEYERGINPLDVKHTVDWVRVIDPVVSDKDRNAPSLWDLQGTGTLPRYSDTT
jgi:dTDP-4-dehydrorhamnose 3,5-epimerase